MNQGPTPPIVACHLRNDPPISFCAAASNANKNFISEQDYTYDAEGEVKTWTKNYSGLAAPQRFDLGYDNADQLTTAPLKNASTNVLIKQYTYGYDTASNRTSETVATTTTTSTPNNVNEITSQSGGVTRTLSYDLNGSITSDGGTRTFEWDGANRLVAINYTGFTTRSEFTYDGLSRVSKIVEKTGAIINSTRKFVWSGQEKLEFRDATDAVTQRNFAQGQFVGTTAYFYTRDHLGSIREMFTGGGTVVARYDYDPFGRSTTVLGTTPTDFNFTGLYRHSKSNLDLAVYRAYDADLGRWLSRDPIGETGGLNLYGYTGNNPLNSADLSGLCPPTLDDAKDLALDAARWLLWDIANTYDWLNAQFFDTFGFPLEQAAPELLELSALRALPAITDVATAGRVLSEGDAILAVVQDGKIIAQSGNLLLSHEQFVARTVGALPQGAEVVTIGKTNGQVLAITSKSFYGHQVPASAAAQKAALGAFR